MAIGFIGAGAQATAYGGAITGHWPTGYAPVSGNLALFISIGMPTSAGEIPTAPSGYTYYATRLHTSGYQIVVWYRFLDGTESEPYISISVGSNYYSSSRGISVQTVIYNGVDTTNPFDVSYVAAQSAGTSTSYLAPAITTATDGAWCLSIMGCGGERAIYVGSPHVGFNTRMSGAYYDTSTWGNYSIGLADYEKTVAGLVTMANWRMGAGTSAPPWYAITMALRPSPSTLQNAYWGIPTSIT